MATDHVAPASRAARFNDCTDALRQDAIGDKSFRRDFRARSGYCSGL